jgi:hypothetical protein
MPRALRSDAPKARAGHDPLAPAALRRALVAIGLVLVAALAGAAVRLLPWVLDPTIPWATLGPFARSLASLAVEASILVGWPVGWALAAQRLVDRGEARVLASLGEAPPRTALRLLPQAALLGAALAVSSVALGREAAAPGRIVNGLLREGRAACTTATDESPATYRVPFVSATWLCAGSPRLVGRAPIGGVVYTASNARVTDDLRRIDLDDARLVLGDASKLTVHVKVSSLSLRGLAPWSRASALHPAYRAALVTSSALLSSAAAVLALLYLESRTRRLNAVAAAALGAAGPLAALATLRGLELRVPDAAGPAWLAAFALVPVATAAAVAAVAAASVVVLALPQWRRAGTST